MTDNGTTRLRHDFVNLWFAQSISQFGDALLEITLPVWVGLTTKSVLQVAGVATAELLPAILVSPIAGVVAERFNPKRVMILADILRGLAVLLLLLFHKADTVYLAYIVSFLLSLGTRIFIPAQAVVVRRRIEDRHIQKAQGALHVASSVSLALGPAIGGALFFIIGPMPAVILDCGTFALSAVLILPIHDVATDFVHPVPRNSPLTLTQIREDLALGLRYMLHNGRLLVVAILTALLTLVGFLWFTVDVFYVSHYLGVPGEAVGYLWTTSGIGDLLAGLIIVPRSRKINSSYLTIAGIFIRAMALVFYAVAGHFQYALVLCLLAGLGDGMASIGLSTLAMQYSARRFLGRVSSALDMVGQFSSMGAAVLVAAIGSSLTSQQILLASGLLLFFAAMWALYWTWKATATD